MLCQRPGFDAPDIRAAVQGRVLGTASGLADRIDFPGWLSARDELGFEAGEFSGEPDPMLPAWLRRLRRSEVTDRVMNDPRTTTGRVLGVNPDEAKREAAGWGQADFDEPWGDLSPDDRVLLYAYFFQLGHLEELVTAFGQLFGDAEPPRDPIVVDLGCGPFTGGLAIAGQFHQDARLDYVGVDRSRAMHRLGARLALAAEQVHELPRISCRWATDIRTVPWDYPPGWRMVVVIVSYLFASPTLDVATLVAGLDDLLEKLGRGSVMVLYTNSVRHDANRQFPIFCSMLHGLGFEMPVSKLGDIEVERRFVTNNRQLRYALFHRPSQRTLELG